MRNALTFDIEDFCQSFGLDESITERVKINTNHLLDILAEKEVKATFFVLGLVAEKFPAIVSRIWLDGHEVATHGYAHKSIFRQQPGEFREELRRSISILEDIIGEKVLGHRAPDYSIVKESLWALDILEEEGMIYDSSILPARNYRGSIPDSPRLPYRPGNSKGGLLEIPLSTARIGGINFPFASGSYLRLYPYRLTRWGIEALNREGYPAMVCLHPYEIDIGEMNALAPKIPWALRLSQGMNRGKTVKKIYRLLSDFEFGPVREVFCEELQVDRQKG